MVVLANPIIYRTEEMICQMRCGGPRRAISMTLKPMRRIALCSDLALTGLRDPT